MSETPQDKVLVLDLTLEESCPEEDKPTKQGKFNNYFDQHRGKVVKAWADGSVEEVATERCEEGIMVGHFKDGTTFTSEVPNVCDE